MRDSAALYEELAEQYAEYKDNFINIRDAINFMITNKDFHKNCDTSDFELFIPSTYYKGNKIDELKNIINLINVDCLCKRMNEGLNNYISIGTVAPQEAS